MTAKQPSVAVKSARISDCGNYRWTLSRHWGLGQALAFVMLNPSTADADVDDPTIRRCMGFAKRDGYDGIVVMNLYALRATDPKHLLVAGDAVGRENDPYLTMLLTERVRRGLPVVAAWGAWPDRDPGRVAEVLDLVTGVDWRCLGHSKSGAPKHPLYIKGDQPFIPLMTPDEIR
jgi:hypothetical protein